MVKYVVAIAMIVVALASCLNAQTCKFNVTGDWDLMQNNGILVKISLTQKGTKVTGLATYQGRKQGHAHTETGEVTGTFYPTDSLNRYRLGLEIKWDYGETGVYTGWIGKDYDQTTGRTDGRWRMRGDAYILQDPNNATRMTAWKFTQDLPCRR